MRPTHFVRRVPASTPTLCLSAETMEKLLKREKEVSTLTSQVEALKSQLGGQSASLYVSTVITLPGGSSFAPAGGPLQLFVCQNCDVL